MERQRPLSEQRKTSFNPEAPTFSPTSNAVTPNFKEPMRPSSIASHSIPPELYDRLITRQYELLSQSKDTSLKFDGEPTVSPTLAVDPNGSPFQRLDVKDGARLVNERISILETRTQFGQANQTNTMGGLTTHASPFPFHTQASEPDLDELNASLGLPGLRTDNATEGNPLHSRISQSPPEISTVYAQYLGNINRTSDDTSRGQFMVMGSGMSEYEEEQGMKIVRPPPGFGGEAPRTIAVEKFRSDSPFTIEPRHIPTGPTAHQSPHRNNSVRSGHHTQQYPHLMRSSPSRRRPRASTRTKRMDQGPEPSAADIYPDDANWEPSRSPHTVRRASVREPSVSHLPPKQEVFVNDPISWPTPAEVYMQKPPTPLRKPPLDVVDDLAPPTTDDINDDDRAIFSLIDSLPHITIDTLLHFGVLDVVSDERPLTPGQLNGRAYGLRNHGLGLRSLEDDWNPDKTLESQPFGQHPRHIWWMMR